jgi:hypothetical protein
MSRILVLEVEQRTVQKTYALKIQCLFAAEVRAFEDIYCTGAF